MARTGKRVGSTCRTARGAAAMLLGALWLIEWAVLTLSYQAVLNVDSSVSCTVLQSQKSSQCLIFTSDSRLCLLQTHGPINLSLHSSFTALGNPYWNLEYSAVLIPQNHYFFFFPLNVLFNDSANCLCYIASVIDECNGGLVLLWQEIKPKFWEKKPSQCHSVHQKSHTD